MAGLLGRNSCSPWSNSTSLRSRQDEEEPRPYPTLCIFFSFRLELIPRRRGVSHSDPLPPHVSSPGVIWFQVEKFQVLLNHVHISLLLPSSAAKSPYF